MIRCKHKQHPHCNIVNECVPELRVPFKLRNRMGDVDEVRCFCGADARLGVIDDECQTFRCSLKPLFKRCRAINLIILKTSGVELCELLRNATKCLTS